MKYQKPLPRRARCPTATDIEAARKDFQEVIRRFGRTTPEDPVRKKLRGENMKRVNDVLTECKIIDDELTWPLRPITLPVVYRPSAKQRYNPGRK